MPVVAVAADDRDDQERHSEHCDRNVAGTQAAGHLHPHRHERDRERQEQQFEPIPELVAGETRPREVQRVARCDEDPEACGQEDEREPVPAVEPVAVAEPQRPCDERERQHEDMEPVPELRVRLEARPAPTAVVAAPENDDERARSRDGGDADDSPPPTRP